MATLIFPPVYFPKGFDAAAAWEAQQRDWVGYVQVRTESGLTYEIEFTSPLRLGQDFGAEVEQGRHFDARPNLILVDAVTLPRMQEAVDQLDREGHFKRLTPLPAEA